MRPIFIKLTVIMIVAAIVLNATTLHAADLKAKPNVILLVADDMRPDCIAALGNKLISTPNLDRLVRDGTSFSRATCAYPICVHSRAELLTGRTTFHNGVYHNQIRFDASQPLWPQAMQRGGYRTFYTGKWHTAGRPSTRGFDESVGLFAGGGGKSPQVDHAGRAVTGYVGWVFQSDDGRTHLDLGIGLTPDISALFADAAIEVVNRPHDRPFFLQVNFTAPHDPRLIPTGYEGKYRAANLPLPKNFKTEHPFDHGNLRGRDEVLFAFPRSPDELKAELAAYYAVISHMDAQIGRILTALADRGLADNTLLIFTADHGLALGSHGLTGKQNMYEHTINVPLIMRGPGIARDRRTAVQCYLRDLYPTVCELAGVESPAAIDGRSVAATLKGDDRPVHPFIVGYFHDSQRMIRDDRWKYIRYPQSDKEQLFDIMNDPEELNDLSGDEKHAEVQQQLKEQLAKWLVDQGDPLARSASKGK